MIDYLLGTEFYSLMITTCGKLPCGGSKWDMTNPNISYCPIKWYP
jgi:hypothetical protein